MTSRTQQVVFYPAVGGALGYITDTVGDLAIAAGEVVAETAQTEMIPHHAGIPIVMPQLSDTIINVVEQG